MLRSHFQKLIVPLLLCCILTLPLASCQKQTGLQYESFYQDQNGNAPVDTLENAENETQTAFHRFTMQLFRKQVTENTLDLHYSLADPVSMNITDYPQSLGDFSRKQMDETAEEARLLRKELKQFSYQELSDSQKLTWDILDHDLEMTAELKNYPYYQEYLKPMVGLQAELPILFAEYTFYSEQDIIDYLALLNDLPRYFDLIITYEQEKADAGLFMSDTCVDMILKDCEAFTTDTENHFLILTFQERLEALNELDESKKSDYIRQNREAFLSSIVPAYQKLSQSLKDLKGSGTNNGGMCNLPKGKKYYQYLLETSTGSDRSVKELEDMVRKQISEDLNQIGNIIQKNPSVYENLDTFSFSKTQPKAILEDLQQKMTADFPQLDKKVYLKVKYVSKSMEDSLSPAFYLTPPIDKNDENVIYINSKLSNPSELYTTLAHEGYPGHLYQTLYSAATEKENPIRSLCSVPGFTEGWATYVENLSYYYDTETDRDTAAILQYNNSSTLGIYALLDMCINYDGWGMDETAEFLKGFFEVDDDAVEELYYTLIAQPCNYLKYYIGYLEILDLEKTAMEEQGNAFDLKEFHEDLLEIGEAPFAIIRKHMK